MKKESLPRLKNRLSKLWILCLLLISVTTASARKTILLLSDTHVMAPQLLVADGRAWQNYLAGDRKMVDKSREIFDALVDTALAQKPDFVLIAGDLTKDGERVGHAYVVQKLDTLLKAGIPTFVVPGNHDLGTANAFYYCGDSTTRAATLSEKDFASLYRNFGYDDQSVRDPNSLSYIRTFCKDIKLLGLDSHTGRLSDSTLNWACTQVTEARKAGFKVIAMMHHPLMEHIKYISRFLPTAVIANDTTVRARLLSSGVHLILTGHFHTSDIGMDYNSNKSDSIFDVNTGSTITYPCPFRKLVISDDLDQVNIQTFYLHRIHSCPDLTDYAKQRITGYIRTHLQAAVKNHFGIPPSLIPSSLTDAVATAYIVHSNGNENLQDTSALFHDLRHFMISSTIRALLTSMLHNVSQYGTDHANVTNDLTLSVPLR